MGYSDFRILVPGQAGEVELLGGVLCLDFVNTIAPRVTPSDGAVPHDHLTSYSDLIEWSQHVSILSTVEALNLQGEAIRTMPQTQQALEQALALREVIYQIFFAISQQREVDPGALNMLKSFYASAMRYAQFRAVEGGDGFEVGWIEQPVQLTRPLWPVIYSAVELLLRGEHRRIKDCDTGDEGCGWLFYDTSKNVSRRWCSMQSCGAEAKERRRGKRPPKS